MSSSNLSDLKTQAILGSINQISEHSQEDQFHLWKMKWSFCLVHSLDTIMISFYRFFSKMIHLTYFQIVGPWHDFPVASNLIKLFKSLNGFGGHSFKIRDVCMDF